MSREGILKNARNLAEALGVSIPQLRFFAALGGDRPNVLFFAGDPGHRIFQQPFSWKSLGVDIRGRSRIREAPVQHPLRIQHCIKVAQDTHREDNVRYFPRLNRPPSTSSAIPK
jgi:hypothetical protein